MVVQINMLQAKTELSKWVKKLEDGEEDVIILARNGRPAAQLVLVPKIDCAGRIGAAKGKFTVPEDFDEWDAEIEDSFEVLG